MEYFDYFFGISIDKLVLGHCDNLSATLQSSTISAAKSQHVASMTVSTLTKIRADECFTLFWDSAQKKPQRLMSVNQCDVERCLKDTKLALQQLIFQQLQKIATTRSILKFLTMLSLLSRHVLINCPMLYTNSRKTFSKVPVVLDRLQF